MAPARGLLGVGPVRPRTSTSWEAGLKSRFADNRIQLNVVGFLTDYNNFQAKSAVLLGNPRRRSSCSTTLASCAPRASKSN
jgi:iron complex outermembrane receptor protein